MLNKTEEEVEAIKRQARNNLGAQIRIWQERFRLDNQAVATRSGVSLDTIYRIKRGDRGASIDVVARLAAGFGIQTAELLMPPEVDNGSE